MKILLIILALLYVLSPYDIFPDFFAIGWGWIDDLIVLGLLWRYLNSLGKKPFGSQQFYRQSHQSAPDSEQADRPKDPYEVLDIPRNASSEEIKNAYRQLANKYHPDKVLHLGEEFRKLAEERFKEVEEAYRELAKK